MVPMKGVVVLAARTARSQAYLQTLQHEGLAPEAVLLYGQERPLPRPASVVCETAEGIRTPNLAVPLERTIREAGWSSLAVGADHVNHPEVIETLRRMTPTLVVFSGYGGQIVGADALGVAPFLHAHAGWLPEERGSTTVYYGILAARRTAVSVIRLDRTIDTGPILARHEYPLPPAGVDVDHGWDGAIRAHLLTRVLRDYVGTGSLPRGELQATAHGDTHYVIHPVLKHLALLSLGRSA